MSAQPFEIRCPACGSVVPPEANGCLNCPKSPAPKVATVAAAAPPPAEARPAELPDLASMRLKDYHRLVQANYRAVEAPAARPGAGFRLRSYLPFALLLVGLIVGAALAFGRL
jgi:hypothetical protein